MNPALDLLHPYPFERLRSLFAGVVPPADLPHINMGIGEPQHPTPKVLLDAIHANLGLLAKYPPTGGTPEFLTAVDGLDSPTLRCRGRCFEANLAGERVTRGAVCRRPGDHRSINPARGAASEPFLPNLRRCRDHGRSRTVLCADGRRDSVPARLSPGFRPRVWPRVQLVYLCSPGNPTGAVMSADQYQSLTQLAEEFDFLIVSDEPYSELYQSEPPYGGIQTQHPRVIVLNSLSKRSSAPGLRSGFIFGAPDVMDKIRLHRTYHGAAPSSVVQQASAVAWSDEAHVEENRRLYREKFEVCQPLVNQVLPCEIPAGGFFLWAKVPESSRWAGSDEAFARELYATANVTVLPGTYLAREANGQNPGAGYVRIALVADLATCVRAAEAMTFAGQKLMPRQNRVTPFSRIEASSARGDLMGNRGILHRDGKLVSERWKARLWITCELEYKGVRRPLMSPGTYTELFFLDEVTAVAAGHRPCALCRREDYNRFRDAWQEAFGEKPPAFEIDRQLHAERVPDDPRRTTEDRAVGTARFCDVRSRRRGVRKTRPPRKKVVAFGLRTGGSSAAPGSPADRAELDPRSASGLRAAYPRIRWGTPG